MLRSLASRLAAQSDLAHASLAVGASASLLPLLPALSPAGLASLHLTSLSAGLGTQLYVTLVSGPTMFLNMPRTAFGDLQARLFPKMGQVCSGSSLLALGSYAAAHPAPDTATGLLAASLVINLLNTFVLFPKCTELQYKLREHKEGTEERKQAAKIFGMTHGISVSINLVAMLTTMSYISLLSARVAGVW